MPTSIAMGKTPRALPRSKLSRSIRPAQVIRLQVMFLAGMDRGLTIDQSVSLAMRAGALMVMRQGTADVIPDLKEVENFSLDQ